MGLEKLGIRALVSVVFGPLIILSAWKGGIVFSALIGSLAVLALLEFYHMTSRKGSTPNKYVGVGTGVVLMALLFYNRIDYVWVLLAAAFFCLITIELFRNEPAPILNVATTFAGVMYVPLLLGFLILIREFPHSTDLDYALGGWLVILIFFSVWICDTAAYILGSRFGRHKLFVRVSPNKTVEGTVFGFLFAIGTSYLCYLFILQEMPLMHVLIIGAICGSLGQVSDLVESLFKRDAQVKDSSNIIPGHGGILDRFDSEILVAPVVYFYLKFVVF